MMRKRHVLLVEDNSMDVQLTRDALAKTDVDVELHVAPCGQVALDYLFGRGDYADRQLHPLPELLLVDLKMVDISGLEVVRQVKGAPELKRIPVVILTSSKEKSDLASCYDAGANSYLVKPVAFNKFVETIKSVVSYWVELNVPADESDGKSLW